PPQPPLLPYTTLFRSAGGCAARDAFGLGRLVRAEALLHGADAVDELHDAGRHAGEHEALRRSRSAAQLGVTERLVSVERLHRQRSEEHTSELQSLTNL